MILSPGFYYFMPAAIFVVVMVSVTAWRIRGGFRPSKRNYLVWLMCVGFVVYMIWMGVNHMRLPA